MDLFLFILSGLVVGVLARAVVPGREPGGWVTSIVIGIAGSFLGGLLGRGLGIYRSGESAGFLMAMAGAVLLLVAYHALARRRGTRI